MRHAPLPAYVNGCLSYVENRLRESGHSYPYRSPDILGHYCLLHLAIRGVVLHYAEIKDQDVLAYQKPNNLNSP